MSLKVGIQLYSVKNNMEKNPIETIKKIVSFGYKYLEVANHFADKDYGVGFNVSSEKMNELLKNINGHIINAHIHPFNEENAVEVIKYHKSIGNKAITCAIDFFVDKAQVMERIKYYNKMGELCAKEGMMFVYHNHFQEFQEIEGKTIFDIIMENTNPKFVFFEIDTFWMIRAGIDPIEQMKKHGDRIKFIHQKDFSKTVNEPINIFDFYDKTQMMTFESFVSVINNDAFVEIGTGTIDIQSLIDAAVKYTKSEYIILEQDYTKLDEIESVKISMDYFKKFKNIEW